ncbi:2-hydroxyacid dehydrogenase [Roseibium algae]|uniref:Glyoxylate/hydroxypyruvate reductase A n=1 Tax=Roseibium algae TaxID=3123038 RepID=A0ABU8TFP3_9HYPH
MSINSPITQKVLPLVARAEPDELSLWCEHLSQALAPTHTVKLLAELSVDECQAAEVAIVANPDPKDLQSLPNLKWVQSLWAGVEHMAAELPQDGPAIVRMIDPQMANTMSEAVLAWTLYLHRDMPRYAKQQSTKIWREHALELPSDRTVTVLGLGNLGKRSALRLKANGFTVCGWSRSAKTIEGVETHSGADGLAKVLSKTDIAVLLMPLTDDTRGLINEQALAHMPKGASLINFARGPIIDDTALIAALDSGQINHAVLDVFASEPLSESNPYWSHPSVTVLPHISAPTIHSTAAKIVAENVAAFAQTGKVPESVDRQRGY